MSSRLDDAGAELAKAQSALEAARAKLADANAALTVAQRAFEADPNDSATAARKEARQIRDERSEQCDVRSRQVNEARARVETAECEMAATQLSSLLEAIDIRRRSEVTLVLDAFAEVHSLADRLVDRCEEFADQDAADVARARQLAAKAGVAFDGEPIELHDLRLMIADRLTRFDAPIEHVVGWSSAPFSPALRRLVNASGDGAMLPELARLLAVAQDELIDLVGARSDEWLRPAPQLDPFYDPSDYARRLTRARGLLERYRQTPEALVLEARAARSASELGSFTVMDEPGSAERHGEPAS